MAPYHNFFHSATASRDVLVLGFVSLSKRMLDQTLVIFGALVRWPLPSSSGVKCARMLVSSVLFRPCCNASFLLISGSSLTLECCVEALQVASSAYDVNRIDYTSVQSKLTISKRLDRYRCGQWMRLI